MRVTHVITRLILGGAQENTLITCRLLAQRGHEVTLITGPALGPEGDLYAQTKNAGYKLEVVDSLRRAINPALDVPAYFALRRHLKQLQPDIVHTHSAKAGILGRMAAHSLKNKWAPDRPVVVHGIHGLSFHPYQSQLLNRCYIAAEKYTARKTDYFISVADAMTDQCKAAGIGRDIPYVTAYSAIDEEAFIEPIPRDQIAAFRAKHDIPPDAVVLVCVARLFMLKGHDYIIESAKTLAKEFDNVIWLFVGDGNLHDHYKNQIRELGLTDRFRFTGLLQPDQIPLAIQASDILVHCSLREGLARTLPQAMLCSRPAISFDVDGAREVVNENTGHLIEPKNVNQLIEACAELIRDKTLREKLGAQAQNAVLEKFAPDTMVDTIEQVYNDLLR